MQTEAKDSKFPAEKLPKRRFHRKSPIVKPEMSSEESNLPRKRKTVSLSLLYPPPCPPLSIVKPAPQLELNDTELKGEIPVTQKHCKCKHSSCVKMYCWCFASGKYCNDCCCSNCQNNVESEEVRQAALGQILQQNQKAFRTMIISSPECSQVHRGGGKDALLLVKYIVCCCKRSHCIQGYCECYQANRFCSESCKCIGCKNVKREGTSSKESKQLKDLEKFFDSNRKDQLNRVLAQSWPNGRRAAPGPLNFRFRSLLEDVIRLQNLTEFCELLMVTSEAVKASSVKCVSQDIYHLLTSFSETSEPAGLERNVRLILGWVVILVWPIAGQNLVYAYKRNPPNLENLSREQTVKHSAALEENQDNGPEDQGPKPDNHWSGIQVDVICKDYTSDAIVQKERTISPGTLTWLCEEKDLFHPDASSDKILHRGCHSDIYAEQEKLILSKFRDFLNSLITHGNAKGKVISHPFSKIQKVNTDS
ncbi:hypothetical protein ACH5RR_024493 [Cinchona calisaya]|uniref:CRC domain-containing protein n=1 Tax=Cinchona calisaya TaxID=153742 RepID=A0ABD2YWU3_9GENT